jgi:superfamily II DNA/RNA helicase
MLRQIILLLSCAALSLAFAPPSRRFSKDQFRLAAEPEYDENASFEDLGLSPEALNAIRAQPGGWTTPTPIQQLVIPKLLDLAAEEDRSELHADSVWCEAPTGSGKTAAYTLPLLQNLSQPKKRRRSYCFLDSLSHTRTGRSNWICCNQSRFQYVHEEK